MKTSRRRGIALTPSTRPHESLRDGVRSTQEEYGAQPPIELLRQWFDNGGWYDRKALTFRQIIDVVFVCACGPPGGGRQSLSARFPRHFNTVGYTPMQVRDSA